MKKMKYAFALFLTMIVLMFPGIASNAAEIQKSSVTRAQWLETLTAMFDMMIVSENMPDNYFSDLEETSEYYEAVMLAVEFGVVDIEAGGEIRPDDPCTRDFAAATLNYCLGFQLDEGTEYTFSDSEQCSDPDSVQIAVNRGWFELSDGKFLPEQAVTAAEVSFMKEDSEAVLESSYIDDTYESTYVFADYVIEIPEGTEVLIDENDVVTIYGAEEEISEGDTFVVYPGELPSLYKAEEVTVSENEMIITTSEADEEKAIVSIDAVGSVEVDLSQFEEAEGVEATYVRTSEDVSRAIQTFGITVEKDSVIATKDIEVADGIEASIVVNLSDLALHHNIQTLKGNYYVAVSGTSTISGNVSVDAIKAAGGETNVVIGTVRVMGVGKVTVSVDLALNGEVTVTYTGDFETGAQYNRGDGFRLVNSFKKKVFSTEAEANSKIGVHVLFGVDIIAAKAELGATTGLAAKFQSETYGDGKLPDNCTNISGWLYADVEAKATLGIGVLSKTFNKSKVIYKESNSPVYVSFHWEDSKRVYECTRDGSEEGTAKYKYFTKDDSPYGTSFYGGGSSVGVGSNGEPFTIFKYALDDNQNATITGYFGNTSVLRIPETIDGYKVTKIGNDSFADNTILHTVIFPDTVVEIGSYAFRGCLGLSNIQLSKSLTTIQNNAFEDCDLLREVLIPKSLTSGGSFGAGSRHGAFRNCSGLKTVRFEEGTTEVSGFLFAHCDGLEGIVIPDTVKVIEGYAFSECPNLKEVTLPKELTTICENAFGNCTSLENIDFPEKLTEIGNDAFSLCTSLQKIELPDSVTIIKSGAFGNCSSLSEAKLSKSLTTIENNAFYECDALTEITIPKSLTSGGSFGAGSRHGAFRNCSGLKTVRFEEGTTEVSGFLFAHCDGLEEIVIPDSVKVIEGYAFSECPNLKEVILPKELTTIYENAFGNCTSLENIDFPEKLTEIGNDAFSLCTSLKKIELPDSVTIIKSGAFGNCSSLSEVKLSKSLTTIENNAFYECDALTEITIPKSLTVGGSFGAGGRHGAFRNCSGLKTVYFEWGMTKIPAFLFAHCDALTKVVIPRTVTAIDESAFSYPASMTIYGIYGSYAENFADEHNIPFVALSIFELEDVYRISGRTRYETSLKIAEVLKAEQKIDKFDTIILADGRNFPDALAGSYLAGKLNSPILMANEKSQYAEPLRKYIQENLEKGGTIYILGGTGAVPDSVLQGVEGFHIKRLAGKNRYETNLLILEEAGVADEAILVCTGRGFADSLSASATGNPILLVGKTLTAEQEAFMAAHQGNSYYIIGGDGAVSSEIEAVVRNYGTVERIAGSSRYETSILVAETFFENPDTAVLASAKNFPDGLCGGPLAMSKNAPLILTATGKEASAAAYAKANEIHIGAVLGGAGLISDEATNSIFGSTAVTEW